MQDCPAFGLIDWISAEIAAYGLFQATFPSQLLEEVRSKMRTDHGYEVLTMREGAFSM